MLHGLIDTLATIHYPAGLIFAALFAAIAATPISWKKARS